MRSNCKIIILSLFFISIFIGQVQAADSYDQFEGANELYVKNKFDDAIELYEKVLKSYPDQIEVHYNLGNAYAQLEKYGKSIYHYQSALKYAPRDADLIANINFINQKRTSTEIDRSFIYKLNKIIYFWTSYFSSGEIIFFRFLIFIIANILWLISIVKKSKKFTSTIIIMYLFFFYISGGYYIKDHIMNERMAVVISEKLKVMPNFIQTKDSIFDLYGGDQVEILSIQKVGKNKEWAQILLPQGKKGWVQTQYIKNI